jgi:hypothetical protein
MYKSRELLCFISFEELFDNNDITLAVTKIQGLGLNFSFWP